MISRGWPARFLLVGALLAGLSGAALSTTWAPHKVKCPLCGAENDFRAIMSYGGYIYNWPSKFQLIFWPLTDRSAVYACKNCRLSAFMGDFEKLPKEKHQAVKNALKDVKFDKEYASYSEIPMTQRLRVAEKVYALLDKDDEFWCRFYRVLAYHYDDERSQAKDDKAREALQKEADAARRKAVELVEKLLAAKDRAGQRKEALLIRGAMRHFLRDDKAALADFEEAAKLTYRNKALAEAGDPEAEKNADEYLSGLLKEYTELLSRKQPLPSDDPEKEADEVTEAFRKFLKEREQKEKEKGAGDKGAPAP